MINGTEPRAGPMGRFIRLHVIYLLFLIAPWTSANALSAEVVFRWCEAFERYAKIRSTDTTEVMFRDLNSAQCIGYFRGIADAVSMSTEEKFGCQPGEFNALQFIMIFQKFIRENPQMLQVSSSNAVVAALVDAFPCKAPTG
jgi:Rap1a immunity proteins